MQQLPAVQSTLKHIIDIFQLNITTLAREADIPSMTPWRAMSGMPVSPAQAQAIANVILRITGIDVSNKIPTVQH
jgi:hypothetical protein